MDHISLYVQCAQMWTLTMFMTLSIYGGLAKLNADLFNLYKP